MNWRPVNIRWFMVSDCESIEEHCPLKCHQFPRFCPGMILITQQGNRFYLGPHIGSSAVALLLLIMALFFTGNTADQQTPRMFYRWTWTPVERQFIRNGLTFPASVAVPYRRTSGVHRCPRGNVGVERKEQLISEMFNTWPEVYAPDDF